MNTKTPLTDWIIQQTNEKHSKNNMNDFDHYMDMVAVLAEHSRDLEEKIGRISETIEVPALPMVLHHPIGSLGRCR